MSAHDVPRPRHVVIIGGGFGGLEAAKALADVPVRVTLVDARNHHLFQPLLYQVAMAGLSPAEIAIPIRAVLSRIERVSVIMATVSRVDVRNRCVHLDDGGRLDYDFVIVAAGARTNYFGHDDWAEHAMALKSVEDAIHIRRRVLWCYERAERLESPDRRKRLLTFVVIGGGPTGVELAGALSELGRRVLAADYRHVHPEDTSVILVEGADRILGGFDPSLSESAEKQLATIGVQVKKGCMVQHIDADGVHLPNEVIPAGAVIWSAGVEAVPLTRTLGVELDRAGRIVVEPDCSVPGHPEAFAIGDNARFEGEDGQPLPGVSPVAMQQAKHVARQIQRTLGHEPRETFQYWDKGMMATIGRSRAIAQTGSLKMTGFLAWVAWLVVHLWYLVGFKNRFFVLMQWIWSYVIYRRGARLITGQPMLPPPSSTGRGE